MNLIMVEYIIICLGICFTDRFSMMLNFKLAIIKMYFIYIVTDVNACQFIIIIQVHTWPYRIKSISFTGQNFTIPL